MKAIRVGSAHKLHCEEFYEMVGDALATSFLLIGLIDQHSSYMICPHTGVALYLDRFSRDFLSCAAAMERRNTGYKNFEISPHL